MKRIRKTLHWLRAAVLYHVGAIGWAKRRLRASKAVVVLTLHRVLTPDEMAATNSLSGMVASVETFEQMMRYAAVRFPVVRAEELISSGADGGNAVRMAVTFDDGWLDVYTRALPVTRRFQAPFALFVCPGLMESESPFWPERAAARWKAERPGRSKDSIEAAVEELKARPDEAYRAIANPSTGERLSPFDRTLSWAQLRRLAEAGVTIGSHTQTHRILTLTPRDEGLAECVTSKDEVELHLGQPCRIFSYPNGDHSAETRSMVAAAGYQLAFTTTHGAWTAAADPLSIPRINLYEDNLTAPNGRFSPLMFEYTAFWRAWRPALGARMSSLFGWLMVETTK